MTDSSWAHPKVVCKVFWNGNEVGRTANGKVEIPDLPLEYLTTAKGELGPEAGAAAAAKDGVGSGEGREQEFAIDGSLEGGLAKLEDGMVAGAATVGGGGGPDGDGNEVKKSEEELIFTSDAEKAAYMKKKADEEKEAKEAEKKAARERKRAEKLLRKKNKDPLAFEKTKSDFMNVEWREDPKDVLKEKGKPQPRLTRTARGIGARSIVGHDDQSEEGSDEEEEELEEEQEEQNGESGQRGKGGDGGKEGGREKTPRADDGSVAGAVKSNGERDGSGAVEGDEALTHVTTEDHAAAAAAALAAVKTSGPSGPLKSKETFLLPLMTETTTVVKQASLKSRFGKLMPTTKKYSIGDPLSSDDDTSVSSIDTETKEATEQAKVEAEAAAKADANARGELVDMVEMDDLELRVEVYVDGQFAGQVQLEGRDMLRQTYRVGDGRLKRAIGFKLLPKHDEKVKVNTDGTAKIGHTDRVAGRLSLLLLSLDPPAKEGESESGSEDDSAASPRAGKVTSGIGEDSASEEEGEGSNESGEDSDSESGSSSSSDSELGSAAGSKPPSENESEYSSENESEKSWERAARKAAEEAAEMERATSMNYRLQVRSYPRWYST